MALLVQFVGSTQIDRPGFVFGFLRRRGVPEATVEEVSLHTLLQCASVWVCFSSC